MWKKNNHKKRNDSGRNVSWRDLWGYFSNKDTEHHEFDLCEACYDRITADFVIPLTVKKEKELL